MFPGIPSCHRQNQQSLRKALCPAPKRDQKVRCDVAACVGEVGGGRSPCRGVRILGVDIGGDVRSTETPDFNPGIVPQVGKNSSRDDIKFVTEGSGIGVEEGTAAIVASTAGALRV